MTLTEPQIWVLIGTFTTVMVGLLGLTLNLTSRTFRAELGRVESTIGAKVDMLATGLGTRMDSLETRMNSLDTRVHDLDRDVSAITRHLLGDKE